MLPASYWFLAWLTHKRRRWGRHVPSKRLLTFNGLHVVSQKIELHKENLCLYCGGVAVPDRKIGGTQGGECWEWRIQTFEDIVPQSSQKLWVGCYPSVCQSAGASVPNIITCGTPNFATSLEYRVAIIRYVKKLGRFIKITFRPVDEFRSLAIWFSAWERGGDSTQNMPSC
jgi:hypothetical protein